MAVPTAGQMNLLLAETAAPGVVSEKRLDRRRKKGEGGELPGQLRRSFTPDKQGKAGDWQVAGADVTWEMINGWQRKV